MDNVYILNYVVQKELAEERRKVYRLFADMKAVFDRVDREKMEDMQEKRGLPKRLIRLVENMYRETKCAVQINGKDVGRLWTRRGLW